GAGPDPPANQLGRYLPRALELRLRQLAELGAHVDAQQPGDVDAFGDLGAHRAHPTNSRMARRAHSPSSRARRAVGMESAAVRWSSACSVARAGAVRANVRAAISHVARSSTSTNRLPRCPGRRTPRGPRSSTASPP